IGDTAGTAAKQRRKKPFGTVWRLVNDCFPQRACRCAAWQDDRAVSDPQAAGKRGERSRVVDVETRDDLRSLTEKLQRFAVQRGKAMAEEGCLAVSDHGREPPFDGHRTSK